MSVRKSIYALGLAVALATPLATFAGGFWHMNGNEADCAGATPAGARPHMDANFTGAGHMGAMHAAMWQDQNADASGNGQPVLPGGQGEWQQFHGQGHAMHHGQAAGQMPLFPECDGQFGDQKWSADPPWGG